MTNLLQDLGLFNYLFGFYMQKSIKKNLIDRFIIYRLTVKL